MQLQQNNCDECSFERFGSLQAIKRLPSRGAGALWLFLCDCGNFISKPIRDARKALKSGYGTGCMACAYRARKTGGKKNRTHGAATGATRKLYDVHRQMMARCYNPNSKDFSNYGGRGIAVCAEWHSVIAFVGWAESAGYKQGLTIERVDVNGQYEPGNCTWIPNEQQALNTRKVIKLHFRGRHKPLSALAAEQGISERTIKGRLKRGWSVERALTEPPVIGRNQYGG